MEQMKETLSLDAGRGRAAISQLTNESLKDDGNESRKEALNKELDELATRQSVLNSETTRRTESRVSSRPSNSLPTANNNNSSNNSNNNNVTRKPLKHSSSITRNDFPQPGSLLLSTPQDQITKKPKVAKKKQQQQQQQPAAK